MSLQRILAAKAFVSLAMEKDAFEKDAVDAQRVVKKWGEETSAAGDAVAHSMNTAGDALRSIGADELADVADQAENAAARIGDMKTVLKDIKSLVTGPAGIIAGIAAATVGFVKFMDKMREEARKSQERADKIRKERAEAAGALVQQSIESGEDPLRAQEQRLVDLQRWIRFQRSQGQVEGGDPAFKQALKEERELLEAIAELRANPRRRVTGVSRAGSVLGPELDPDMVRRRQAKLFRDREKAQEGGEKAMKALPKFLADAANGVEALANSFSGKLDPEITSAIEAWRELWRENKKEIDERLAKARDNWARWRVNSRVDAIIGGGGGTASQLGSFAAGRGGLVGGVMRQTETEERRKARVQGKIIAEELVKGLKPTQEGAEAVWRSLQQTWGEIVGTG